LQDGRIHIDKINYPFMDHEKAKPSEYGARLKLAIERAGSRRLKRPQLRAAWAVSL
jgi:hypothetical protein